MTKDAENERQATGFEHVSVAASRLIKRIISDDKKEKAGADERG